MNERKQKHKQAHSTHLAAVVANDLLERLEGCLQLGALALLLCERMTKMRNLSLNLCLCGDD